MSDEAESERSKPPTQKPPPADDTVERLFRVARRFMVPFMLSWAIAFIGSQRDIEWLYFAGLGGVTLSMLGLMVWLIH